MTEALLMANTQPCGPCAGTGLVARAVAAMAENDYVRRYAQSMPGFGQETCSRCGGSGSVPLDPSTVREEPKASDHGDCCG